MNENMQKIVAIREKISFFKALFFGFQAVISLNLFLGAIVIADTLKMDVSMTALMITMSFLATGVATCIQAGWFMKYPVVQGVSFATIGAIVSITLRQDLATAFGCLILGAVVFIVIGYCKVFSKIVDFFIPPLVAGVVVIVIGLSFMLTSCMNLMISPGKTGINFLGFGIAFILTMLFMMIGKRPGRLANLIGKGAVLYAIMIGAVVVSLLGALDFAPVQRASWFALPKPFPFGWPKFDLGGSLVMVFIYFIVMVEAVGCWFTVSFITGEKLEDQTINRGIVGQGYGSLIGAFLGGAPMTSYSPNCGIISVTKVYSYWVSVAAGILIVIFSFCPKLMILIAVIPTAVMWGILAAMSTFVLMNGLRSIQPFALHDRNALVVCLPVLATIGTALLPTALVQSLPMVLSYFFSSSIAVGALAVMVLNKLLPEPPSAP